VIRTGRLLAKEKVAGPSECYAIRMVRAHSQINPVHHELGSLFLALIVSQTPWNRSTVEPALRKKRMPGAGWATLNPSVKSNTPERLETTDQETSLSISLMKRITEEVHVQGGYYSKHYAAFRLDFGYR
jgi:hypothetical protein